MMSPNLTSCPSGVYITNTDAMCVDESRLVPHCVLNFNIVLILTPFLIAEQILLGRFGWCWDWGAGGIMASTLESVLLIDDVYSKGL